MAGDLEISDESVRRIVNEKLHLRSYRLLKCQSLSAADKLTTMRKCKELFGHAADGAHWEFVFNDEKLFGVEAAFYRQNGSIRAKNLRDTNSGG